MVDYQVTVSTSYLDDAGTCDHVFIKLVGDKESERTRLMGSEGESSFIRGAVSSFTVSCPVSIGKLKMIELDKQPSQTPAKWFPTKVEVKSPEGDTFKFPICSWITDSEVHRFIEGREPEKQPFQKLDTGSPPPEGDTSNFHSNRWQTDSKVPHFNEGTEPGKQPFQKLDTGSPPPEGDTSSDRRKTSRKVPRVNEGTGDTYNFFIYCRNTDSVSEGTGDTYNFSIYCRNTDSVSEGKGRRSQGLNH